MRAKSFIHTTSNGVKSEVAICSVPAGIRLTISGDATISGWFDSTQGAEIALAVLEASGVEPVNHTVRGLGNPNWLEGIAHSLQLHIEQEAELNAAAEAEAEEMAKLEAEALELFNARQEAINSFDWEPYKDFANEDSKQTWLAVARRAREINKEEK